MKWTTHPTCRGGFTLMETVIAIGVLAVLLTAFLAVFTPAAQGIRKAISAEDADRLALVAGTSSGTSRKRAMAIGMMQQFKW